MTNRSFAHLSDRALLDATARAAEACRHCTTELLALLAEVDARKLYLGEGYSSLFTYCTQKLRLSEPAAYSRITAARAARRMPVILELLANGDVTLTTITLLASHLTDENSEQLLTAARHKSKRDVELLVAAIDPQPDVPSSVRKLPAPSTIGREQDRISSLQPAPLLTTPIGSSTDEVMRPPTPTIPRAVVAPIAPARYLVKMTISQETHAKLERARALLRHSIPNGDTAAIVDRALTVLVEQLERTKCATVRRPLPRAIRVSHGRHIPAVDGAEGRVDSIP